MGVSNSKSTPIKTKIVWYRKLNGSLIIGITVALLLNGAAVIWMMKQPLPPFLFQLADNMNALFKPVPTPCPPFESAIIRNSSGTIIENQYVVPTFLVPHNRLPFPDNKKEVK